MVSILYKKFGFTTGRLREVLADKRLNKIISHGKKSISLMFFLRLQNQAFARGFNWLRVAAEMGQFKLTEAEGFDLINITFFYNRSGSYFVLASEIGRHFSGKSSHKKGWYCCSPSWSNLLKEVTP